MQSFVDALIRKDIDAALPLLTDDVALFYSNGSAVWGTEAFATAIMANWKRIEEYHYTTDDSIWVAQSDTAAAVMRRHINDWRTAWERRGLDLHQEILDLSSTTDSEPHKVESNGLNQEDERWDSSRVPRRSAASSMPSASRDS